MNRLHYYVTTSQIGRDVGLPVEDEVFVEITNPVKIIDGALVFTTGEHEKIVYAAGTWVMFVSELVEE